MFFCCTSTAKSPHLRVGGHGRLDARKGNGAGCRGWGTATCLADLPAAVLKRCWELQPAAGDQRLPHVRRVHLPRARKAANALRCGCYGCHRNGCMLSGLGLQQCCDCRTKGYLQRLDQRGERVLERMQTSGLAQLTSRHVWNC